MLENSSMPTSDGAVDQMPLTDLERLVLAMFRRLNEQQQEDLLRFLSAYAALPE
ncbi:hypothetical protein D3C84_976620 [compost metagenome]